MKSVLYLGCPGPERADAERLLGAANVSVIWADNVAYALSELQRKDVPVLLDLSRGAAALQHAREIRNHRASTLMFAVVFDAAGAAAAAAGFAPAAGLAVDAVVAAASFLPALAGAGVIVSSLF